MLSQCQLEERQWCCGQRHGLKCVPGMGVVDSRLNCTSFCLRLQHGAGTSREVWQLRYLCERQTTGTTCMNLHVESEGRKRIQQPTILRRTKPLAYNKGPCDILSTTRVKGERRRGVAEESRERVFSKRTAGCI